VTNGQRLSLADAAREHTETALDVLVAIATEGHSESARVAAACALLDRGYGKPRQALDHVVEPRDYESLSDAEIDARINADLAKLEELSSIEMSSVDSAGSELKAIPQIVIDQ